MKYLKSIGYVFFFLLTIVNIVYSIDLNQAQTYYSHDADDTTGNLMLDISGNGNDGTCIGFSSNCGTVPGLVVNSSNFTGNSYINMNTSYISTGAFSVATWIQADVVNDNDYIASNTANGGTTGIALALNSNKFKCIGFGSSINMNSVSTMSVGSWHHVACVYNGSQMRLYVNGSLELTANGTLSYGVGNWYLGQLGSSSVLRYDGRLDETAFYNDTLTTAQVNELYNAGAGYNPYSGVTPAITVNITNGSYFNYNNINVSLNTTSNVNMSVYLNGDFQSIANDTNYTTYILSSVEGKNNASFLSVDSFGSRWTNITYFVDTVNPSLNVTSNINLNSYTIDWTDYINYSDLNILSCNVTIYGQSNTNCNDTSYTFVYNGNFSFNVTVTDLAGNTNTSLNNNVYINPYFYVYFKDLANNTLSNFVVNGTSYTNYMNETIYEYGLGTHGFVFEKGGYNNQEFNLTFTNTSNINATVNVTQVTLSIKVYDASNPSTQLTFNVTLLNDSDSNVYTNQVNFTGNYSDIVHGDIEAIISSAGYSTAYFYTMLTNQSSVSITAYLFPNSTTSVHTFTITDLSKGSALANVSIDLQMLINGTYTTLSMAETGSNGKAFFYLDSSISYKVIFSRSGYVTATAFTIPTITEYTVKLEESTSIFSYIEDVSYAFQPSNTYLNDNKTVNFSGFISSSSLTYINYTLVLSNGTTIYSSTSTNPSGTTFIYSYDIDYGTNITSILASLTYIKNGVTNTLTKNYSVNSFNNDTLLGAFDDYGKETSEEAKIFRWLFLMTMVIGIIIGGTFLGITDGVNLMLIPLFAGLSYVGWIDWVYGAVIIFILLVFYIGGRGR